MMLAAVLIGPIIVAAVGVWCVAQDRGWALPLSRLLRAAGLATLLAITLQIGIIVMPLTCSQVEEYSFLWYVMWCMDHSH